jgi:hypothetical protein
MATTAQIDTVTRHFIIAALWADSPEGTSPRAPSATQEKARKFCAAFIAKNETLFNEAMARGELGYGSHPDAGSPEAAFGHDLWLTIGGHGVGFWDRSELDSDSPEVESLGDRLTTACESYRYKIEPEFYRGWLYIHGGEV